MSVEYSDRGFGGQGLVPVGLRRQLSKLDRVAQSTMDFIPFDDSGRIVQTKPLEEISNINAPENYIKAAQISLTNPLCFIANKVMTETLASGADFIVKERQFNSWVIHRNNPLDLFLENPNETMSGAEFLKAYATHINLYGICKMIMFQKGDMLPNGDICEEHNQLDIVFPSRLQRDWSERNSRTYYYQPLRYFGEPFRVDKSSVFTDAQYNSTAHELGIPLPTAPLQRIFAIHEAFLTGLEELVVRKGIWTHVLKRIYDMNKDGQTANSPNVQDEIEETMAMLNDQLNGRNETTGVVGLNGNYDLMKLGSPLNEYFSKELIHLLETLISGTFGVPPSIFWAGLEYSNQRASRQSDSIDFYNRTIHPFLFTRAAKNLGKFLIPMFLGSKWKQKFILDFDVSKMPLAQFVRSENIKTFERWWSQMLIPRGRFYELAELDVNLLTKDKQDEYYSGGKQDKGLSQVEYSNKEDNGLE